MAVKTTHIIYPGSKRCPRRYRGRGSNWSPAAMPCNLEITNDNKRILCVIIVEIFCWRAVIDRTCTEPNGISKNRRLRGIWNGRLSPKEKRFKVLFRGNSANPAIQTITGIDRLVFQNRACASEIAIIRQYIGCVCGANQVATVDL